jgi:hypothetical protein
MHHRNAIRALVAALLALLLVSPGVARAEEPGCAPTPTGAPLTLTNHGGQRTRPFELAGGTYHASWSGEVAAGDQDNLIVDLKRADGQRGSYDAVVNVILGRQGQPSSGETYLYNVKPGAYYLDVLAPARWTVTLTPIAT